jgi:hypothetical protein
MNKCAHCDSPTTGKSKYCREHATLARAAWREMLADKASERDARYAEFRELVGRAHAAGMAAGRTVQCEPMGVARVNADGSRTLVDIVPDGPCGFAWITIRPGNSSFAIWAKRNRIADRAYGGGVSIWVGEFGQSMTRKQAYAYAYAGVLQDAGVKAYSGSRMD